jgi:hypothetical protein
VLETQAAQVVQAAAAAVLAVPQVAAVLAAVERFLFTTRILEIKQMANYAVMSDNTVVNVIVTDDKEQGEKDLNCTLIEITDGGIGWIWDGTKFIDPSEVTNEASPE